ncbi:DUF927 domain-containing protein [Enterococcus durans]|uniref:DUF927 domain-containing protein n=1 Tax=Enterococcus durans TaxID=53345 RepID=UPI0039A5F5F8
MKMNHTSIQKHLQLLNTLGISYVNLRTFSTLNKKTVSHIFSTADSQAIINYLEKQKLSEGTVNITYNPIKQEVITQKKHSVRDNDIEKIRFVFIDIDPKRKEGSATDSEKKKAENVMEQVERYLKEQGIESFVKVDSGNGYHIFLPINEQPNNHETILTIQNFLQLLHRRFGVEDEVDIDTSVYNPSRLCKLVGTPAVKGKSTKERPHRLSSFLSIPDNIDRSNCFKILEQIVEENSMMSTSRVKSRPSFREVLSFIQADYKQWLAHYPELTYTIKEGDHKGVTLLIFDECPLRKHTNNSNGSCLSVTADNKIRFHCLHASDKNKDIQDFVKKYPLPKPVNPSVESLESNQEYYFDQFKLNQEGVFLVKEGQEEKVACPMFIKQIRKNIEQKVITLVLAYYVDHCWDEIEIEGGCLQTNNFKQLAKHGLIIKARREAEVVDFLQIQRENAPIFFEHESLGWKKENEAMIFQLQDSFGREIPSVLTKNSCYQLTTNGTEAEFDALVHKYVLGTNLELAWSIGIASIVLGYLNVTKANTFLSLLINLQGKSTTGKTTTLHFIASLFGNPTTVLRNMNATNKAIIKLASNNQGGVPLILDELGAATQNNFSSLIYQLASGEERLRLDSNCQLMPQETFSVLTLTSSEERLENYFNEKLTGLKVRYIEFSDIKFTKDANHAEKVKSLSSNTFGWGIKLFLLKLFEQGIGKIEAIFVEAKKKLWAVLPEHSLKQRIGNNLALIYSGALLIQDILGYPLRLEHIQTVLINSYEQLIVDTSLGSEQTVFDRVKTLLVMNSHKFLTNSDNKHTPSTIWGKVSIQKNGDIKVNIFPIPFEDLLRREFQVKDLTYLFRQLLDSGNMCAEKGRRTKRIHMNRQVLPTYEILLPSSLKSYFRL